MNDARIISPSDVRLYYFGSKDVLFTPMEKESRINKLNDALSLSSREGRAVSFYMKLPSGETLEMESKVVDIADDFVIINGGFAIPVWAIVDIRSNCRQPVL